MLTNRRPGPFRALLGLAPLITMAFTADTSGAATGGSGEAPPAGGKPEGDKPPADPPPADATTGTLTQAQVNALVAQTRRETEAKFAPAVAAQAELDKIKEASASELDKAVKKAKEEGSAETGAQYQGVLIGAEVRAQAAGMHFRNPRLALASLQASGALTGVKVEVDGTVDAKAVETALAALAVSDPYLIDSEKAPEPPPAGEAGLGGATSSGGKDRSKITPGMGTLRSAYDAIGEPKTKAKAT